MEEIPYDQRNNETEKLMEKLNRLVDLRKINDDLFVQIQNYNLKIAQAKIDQQSAKNEYNASNILLQSVSVAPELLPPPEDDDQNELIQPIQEHAIILSGKIKALNAKNSTIKQNQGKIMQLENNYRELMNAELKHLTKIAEAQEQLNDFTLLQKCTTEEISFLENQKKERKLEINRVNQRLTDAQNAYDEVRKRAEVTISDSKNDLTREVLNKQNEVISLEEQIAAVKRRLYNLKVYSSRMDFDRKLREEQAKKQANWAADKKQLQATLHDLKLQLSDIRSQARQGINFGKAKEDTELLTQEELEKYGSLLRMWAGKAHDAEPAKGDINELYEQIQEPRRRLATLMDENAMKERELEKKRKGLNRRVHIFRDTESRNIIEQEELTESFKKAEARLLAKIKQAKITIAQNRLKKQ